MSRRWRWLAAFAVAAAGLQPLEGAVTRMEVLHRGPFAEGREFGAAGAYEKLTGWLHIEVDPADPANSGIVDLDLAPKTNGKVVFRTEFFLLKPTDASRGNGWLLYDVNNRGNKLALACFNEARGNDPTTPADAGNGFLMQRGYSVLWCGWNGDVLPGEGRMQIELPVAGSEREPVTGCIYSEICVEQAAKSAPLCWGQTRVYPPITPDPAACRLEVRERRDAPGTQLKPDEWAFARWENNQAVPDGTHLYVKAGLRPGWLYDLVYTASSPRVSGLGFAAVRDASSFFRYGTTDAVGTANPLAGRVSHACIFGISQSGRVISDLLYQDFNGDEAGRMDFDAAFLHVAAAGRMLLNQRFAQVTRHGSQHEDNLYPTEAFPFATVKQSDPLTGRAGDALERSRKAGHLPRMIMTATSTEYWGRGGSLLHTDVEGKQDVALDPAVRLYFIAGGHHLFSTPPQGICQHPVNTLNYRPLMRALLVALEEWVANGREPPPSSYPRIADGTLISVEQYRKAFPKMAGVTVPARAYAPLRLDLGPRWESQGIADECPPKAGPAYAVLVPAIDANGNELAGIRLPEQAVPAATYAGWNVRASQYGPEGILTRWIGSQWPFPDRPDAADRRPALSQRHPDAVFRRARQVKIAEALVARRLLLREDMSQVVASRPPE